MPYFKSQGKLITIGSSTKFLTYTDSPKEYEYVRIATSLGSSNNMVKLSRKGDYATWISNTGTRRVLIFNLNPYTLLLNHAFISGQITGDSRSAAFNQAGNKLYIAWYTGGTAPFIPYLSVYSYLNNTLTQIYKQQITDLGSSNQIFDTECFQTPNGTEYLVMPFIGNSFMHIWKILPDGISFEPIYMDTVSFHGVHVTKVIDNETIEFAANANLFRLNFVTGVKITLVTNTPRFVDVRYPYLDEINKRLFLGNNGNFTLQVFNTKTGNFSEFVRNANFYTTVYSAITYGNKLYVGTTGSGVARILEFNRI